MKEPELPSFEEGARTAPELARALIKYLKKGHGEHLVDAIDRALGLIRVEVDLEMDWEKGNPFSEQHPGYIFDIRYACIDGRVGHLEMKIRIEGWGQGIKSPEEAADKNVGIIVYPDAEAFIVEEE